MVILLKVKGIGSLRHELDEFVSIFLYFLDINLTNYLAYIYIYKELQIVEGLKENLLVSNDILTLKKVIIGLTTKFAIISSCQIAIFITARLKSYPIQRKTLINRLLLISPEFKVLMQFFCFSLPNN